jgi:hypothetical protein
MCDKVAANGSMGGVAQDNVGAVDEVKREGCVAAS